MGPSLKWWTAIKAALVVCWETKRAFDHLGAHHFLMPFLKHDYREMSPLTLYVPNLTQSPSHSLCHTSFFCKRKLNTVVWPKSSMTLSLVTFPARSPPTTAAIWSTELPIITWKLRGEARVTSCGGWRRLYGITPREQHCITYFTFPRMGHPWKCTTNP